MRRSLLPLCLVVFGLLAGCGNKGPLVRPPRDRAVPAAAASAPAPVVASSASGPG